MRWAGQAAESARPRYPGRNVIGLGADLGDGRRLPLGASSQRTDHRHALAGATRSVDERAAASHVESLAERTWTRGTAPQQAPDERRGRVAHVEVRASAVDDPARLERRARSSGTTHHDATRVARPAFDSLY